MRKRSRLGRFLVVAGVVALVGFAAVQVWARTTPRPSLSRAEGRLAPCPDRMNCVSTQTPGTAHFMTPIAIGSAAVTREQLVRRLESMPRTRIVANEPDYIAAECRSLVFGFVDDVEFLIDEPNGLLHFRSASRCGYSDMGVNRKRLLRVLAGLDTSAPQSLRPSVP